MYALANEEYREKQKRQLIRLREYQLKKEAQRAAIVKEEEEKAQKAKEEADRLEEERKQKQALKEKAEREERERQENEAKAAFSSFLPSNLIELSSEDGLSDIDEEKDKNLKEPKIKEEKIDSEYEKLKPQPNGNIPNGNGEPHTLTEEKTKNIKSPAEIKAEPKSPTVGNPGGGEPENGVGNGTGDAGGVGTNEVEFKPVHMDPRTDKIESTLTELGTLIVDEDVLYALRNLKHIGHTMKQVAENDEEAAKQGNLVGRSLFRDFKPNASGVRSFDILTPLDGPASIKEEPKTGFHSPPHHGQAFSGLKCMSSDRFIESYGSSAKRRRNTPGRSPVMGSPASTQDATEILQSQSEAKGKLALAADTFLKKKKMTSNNHMTIFDAVSKKKRDIIEFDDGPQSFYRIMTHYAPNLNFMPEDVKHKEVQQNLFTFVMENVKYTKVHFVYCCVHFLNIILCMRKELKNKKTPGISQILFMRVDSLIIVVIVFSLGHFRSSAKMVKSFLAGLPRWKNQMQNLMDSQY